MARLLEGRLAPRTIGERSCQIDVSLVGPEDDVRAAFDITLVCVERDAVASRAWPEDLAAAMKAWLAEA